MGWRLENSSRYAPLSVKEVKMFKWFTNRIIDNYVKAKIKEIQAIDIKNKVKEYVKEHKDEIIAKIREAIEKALKNIVDKVIKDFEDKIHK